MDAMSFAQNHAMRDLTHLIHLSRQILKDTHERVIGVILIMNAFKVQRASSETFDLEMLRESALHLLNLESPDAQLPF
jgi:hypothetical protein